MKRATIRDVAADAGVSIGTASKALNGQGRLRPETRERVAEAARKLGFAPNPLAQALLAGRTYTVGMITTDSFGRFSIPVMLGAEDALGAGRMSVFMCDSRDDPERERRYVEMLTARRVDGLIVTGRRIEPRPSPEVFELAESKGFALGPPSRPPQVLVLAMKPQNLEEAATGLAPFASRDTLVVSILAGKSLANVAARLPHATAIVRAMPNLAAAVGRGMAVLAANAAATPGQRATAEALFAATGRVEWAASEELIDAALRHCPG